LGPHSGHVLYDYRTNSEEIWLRADIDIREDKGRVVAARIIRRLVEEDERRQKNQSLWGKLWMGVAIPLLVAIGVGILRLIWPLAQALPKWLSDHWR
jgi:hypothetical protein